MPDSPPGHHDTTAVLFSGGLDSTALVAWLLDQDCPVQPIYVRGGLLWEAAELAAAQRIVGELESRYPERLARLQILRMPVNDLYGEHWSLTGRGIPDYASSDDAVLLPGRNPLLLLKASLWCIDRGIGRIAVGTLGRNPFRDATEPFFHAFEQMLWEATGARIEIVRPFAGWSKEQILALRSRIPWEATFSCLAPVQGGHCGRCNKCAERYRALSAAGLPAVPNAQPEMLRTG